MSSFYRKQLEGFLAMLDVSAMRVYDIGGSQLPVKDRVKSFEATEYKIVDLPVPHKGAAPDIAYDLCGYANWDHPKADLAFCLEVSEYFTDPAMAIQNLARMIVPGGCLYITFPFVYPQHEPLELDCMRYTRAGAIKLLNDAAFRIETVTPRLALNDAFLRNFYAADGMRASKATNHSEIGYIIKAIRL